MSTNRVSRRGLIGAVLAMMPLAASAQGSLLEQGEGLLNKVPGGAGAKSSGAGAGAGLSQGDIGAGLKDALKVASQRVVGRVGKTDGYNGDPSIRIPLPEPLTKIEGPLKTVGASGMLDDLQVRMNRAAEQAAPKALNIFENAVASMSISDARGILSGPQDAATQYFKRTTSASLTSSFRPIVDSALSNVGAVSTFKSVQAKAGDIPFAGQEVQGFNLTDFTVGKALDGLFHYMGVEEAAIRTNPAARTTDLLKKVFG
ncbi:MAG TPA: DUF4197 domain-containing protein [Stellaceae bacterium]|nr:DUF4197 domain-containing protein [Stellaceae bacterium]